MSMDITYLDPDGIPEPFDPMCGRQAATMSEYDDAIFTCQEEIDDQTPDQLVEARIAYVRTEEGTYNPSNGHFLCDRCYIEAGQPSSPGGWRCP